jgi:hypothetical protein
MDIPMAAVPEVLEGSGVEAGRCLRNYALSVLAKLGTEGF